MDNNNNKIVIEKGDVNNYDNNNDNNENKNEIIYDNNIDDKNAKNKINFIESKDFIEKKLYNSIEMNFKKIFEELNTTLLKDINVLGLNIDEISNISEKCGIEILLMNENSFKQFKKFINYDLINNYINLSSEQKNNYIEKNINKFNEILNIFKNKNIKMPKDILLNNQCLNNKENDNKFYLLNAFPIYKKKEIDSIYYFISDNESYIFFKENKKVFKVIKEENEYYKLNEYTFQKEISNKELIFIIKEEINNNKKIDNLIKYKQSQYDNFIKFYIINENWFNNIINKNGIIWAKFDINPIFNYEGPHDFGLIAKNETNDLRMQHLINQNEIIKYEDLLIAELFIVDDINYNPNKLYFGLILNKKRINFYLIHKEKYLLEYIIYYENEEIMKEEIKKNIIPAGIEEYLYEIGLDFSIIDIPQSLYNIELKKVGLLLNKNNKNIKNIEPDHTISLTEFEGSFYYSAIMQCLANIVLLKDIFLNREQLFKENIIEDYKKITNKFYIIMQYMWHWKNISFEQKGQYTDLLLEIQSLSGINNIYDKLDLLIEFILLAIHSEQTINIKENKINYKLNELQIHFYRNNKSFIKDLIFCNLQLFCDKCNNKLYLNNYILYYIGDLIKINNITTKKVETIENLLSFKQEIFCDKCQNIIYSNKIFISLPKVLIIIIQDIRNNDIKFKISEKINIKNVEKKKGEYELISLIKEIYKDKNDKKEKEEKEKEEKEKGKIKNKKVITYFKSPTNNSWYRFIEQNKIEPFFFKDIKNEDTIPSLLIYKKI